MVPRSISPQTGSSPPLPGGGSVSHSGIAVRPVSHHGPPLGSRYGGSPESCMDARVRHVMNSKVLGMHNCMLTSNVSA